MQSIMSRQEMDALVKPQGHTVASMLMPAERAGAETRENRPRLKNLAGRAEQQLVDAGLRSADARAVLSETRAMLEDTVFWRHQGEGLAVFASPAQTRWYRTPMPLPEVATAANRFHVKPLMPLAVEDARAFVLELSGKRARLLEVTLDDCRAVEAPGMPDSYEHAMRHDDPEKSVQFHTGTSGANAASTAGKRAAIHHGQGATHDEDQEQRRWRQYCGMVENAVTELLRPTGAPLMIAATEPTASVYRAVNQYDHLLDETLGGNHDHLDDRAIHEQAAQQLKGHLGQRFSQAVAGYREADGTDHATDDLLETVIAADDGRIATLIVASDAQRWGDYKPDKRVIAASEEPAGGRDDLLNFAACRAYETGAEVFSTPLQQMPGESPVAAVLRVPIPAE